MTNIEKTLRISIYLIKPEYESDEEILENIDDYDKYKIKISGHDDATLFVARSKSKVPDWTYIFDDIDWNKYKISNIAGVLLSKFDDRYFAIPFNTGRYFLKREACVDKFGFKVVVNSVNPNTIKIIQKKSISKNPKLSKEQITKDSSLGEFNIDYYTDFVSSIKATSTDLELGKKLEGKNSLKLLLPFKLNDLPSLLQKCLRLYSDTGYKANFPYIDNIADVTDPEVKSKLIIELENQINTNRISNIWTAIPDFEDERSLYYHYSKGTDKKSPLIHHDISLDEFLKEKKLGVHGKPVTYNSLKSRKVFINLGENNIYPKWSILNCLYAELYLDSKLFVLIEGKWYQPDKDFVSYIDSKLEQIPIFETDFPIWNKSIKEGTYIKNEFKNSKDYCIMDAKNIKLPGQTPIEVCDLISKNRQLIHIKRYSSSSTLSHLFSQGLNSCELLIKNQNFRKLANKKLHKDFRVSETNFDSRKFTVIYLIGTKFRDDWKMPLFSRITLVRAYEDLIAFGFKVMKGQIQME